MPYVYILKCADGTYYTGSTWSLAQRLAQHESGEGANYTRKHGPVVLAYREYYDSIRDAWLREKQIQGWSHDKKKALIEGDVESLVRLSRPREQAAEDGG
ncbi:MAG: GIY-YIG nuclease family protein [Anaerolineae bacterium]|jgi:putative endonuclease|nr:GIY-YIG nuclease family protein [Anaerolineae bacterium]